MKKIKTLNLFLVFFCLFFTIKPTGLRRINNKVDEIVSKTPSKLFSLEPQKKACKKASTGGDGQHTTTPILIKNGILMHL